MGINQRVSFQVEAYPMCCEDLCCDDPRTLSFDTLLSDPLIRLVMESDGVTRTDMVAALEVARASGAARAAFTFAQVAPVGHG